MFYPVLIGWVAGDSKSLSVIQINLTISKINVTITNDFRNLEFVSSICKLSNGNLTVPILIEGLTKSSNKLMILRITFQDPQF
jgi:hypothetical protein